MLVTKRHSVRSVAAHTTSRRHTTRRTDACFRDSTVESARSRADSGSNAIAGDVAR